MYTAYMYVRIRSRLCIRLHYSCESFPPQWMLLCGWIYAPSWLCHTHLEHGRERDSAIFH